MDQFSVKKVKLKLENWDKSASKIRKVIFLR